MSVELESRIASLEGSYVDLSGKIDALRSDLVGTFQWTVGLMFASWITLLVAILLHH